ncbi:MAG: hypothetical protein ACYCYK_09470 [Candidatus Dormibacteria bacterium]
MKEVRWPSRARAGGSACSRSSDLGVELHAEFVPVRHRLREPGPECRLAPGIKGFRRDPLLVDRREVAEVEDPGPVLVAQFQQL